MVDWGMFGLAALRQREDFGKLLSGGFTALFGRSVTLALTGMQGVGKTVLFDRLTGKALKPDYQLPGQSQKGEQGKLQRIGSRIRVSVVPGQEAQPRHLALDDLFGGKKRVDGVVHVVGYGYASVRNQDAAQSLVSQAKLTTLNRYLKHQREQELVDLRRTCEQIRGAHRRHHAPTWMIVALDKVDLYHDEIEAARTHYSSSGFAAALDELRTQVGQDNFRWECVPVCALLEDFEWNGKRKQSQLTTDNRDELIVQFKRRLQEFSA